MAVFVVYFQHALCRQAQSTPATPASLLSQQSQHTGRFGRVTSQPRAPIDQTPVMRIFVALHFDMLCARKTCQVAHRPRGRGRPTARPALSAAEGTRFGEHCND